MGRPCNEIESDNPFLAMLAHNMRVILTQEGLTFQQLSERVDGISRITFQRAASGKYMPKEKTLVAFTEACDRPAELPTLLKLRVEARILERGRLKKLSAPRPELISDRRDLSRALEWLYEAAGAPAIREIQTRSQQPFVLPTSTIQRIIARTTTPVDLPQLLAFVRGCGYDGDEKIWTDVWNKITKHPVPDPAPAVPPVVIPKPAPATDSPNHPPIVRRQTDAHRRRTPQKTGAATSAQTAHKSEKISLLQAAAVGGMVGGVAGLLAILPGPKTAAIEAAVNKP